MRARTAKAELLAQMMSRPTSELLRPTLLDGLPPSRLHPGQPPTQRPIEALSLPMTADVMRELLEGRAQVEAQVVASKHRVVPKRIVSAG